MLRATRRLLRPGRRTAFAVIHVASDLSPAERRWASSVGPSFVATRGPSYEQLLRSAGFVDVEGTDVTAAYERLLGRWLRRAAELREELAAAEPPGAFVQRLEDHTSAFAAVRDGLLRRSLLVARRPA